MTTDAPADGLPSFELKGVGKEKARNLRGLPYNVGLLDGAGGRGRTGMPLRALDFESSASTNFTTPAEERIITNAPLRVKQEISI